MTVSDSFCRFFDKTISGNYDYRKGNESWNVHENDKGAKLTDLEIKFESSEFIGFNQEMTKSMPNITSSRSTLFKDKECDGVAILRKDNRENLLFVELKSKYDTRLVFCAIEQMCFSFLKMHSMLSLCNGYSLKDLDVTFCIATRCAEDNEKAKAKLFISQALMSEEQKGFGQFFRKLVINGHTSIVMDDLFKLKCIDLPLHDDIKSKKVTVFLVISQRPEDNRATFNY